MVGSSCENESRCASSRPRGSLREGARGFGDDRGYAVAVDAAGNGYVTGHFQNGASLDGTSLTNYGGVDLFLAKFSPSGQLLWSRVAGGPGVDVGYGVAVDPVGEVLICGYHGAQARFGENLEEVQGNVDLFLAKYTSEGELSAGYAWFRAFL